MKYPLPRLGVVADFIRGVSFKPDDVQPLGTESTIACFRTKNVQAEIDLSDVWAVPNTSVNRSEQILQEGDLLVSTANSWNLVGKCCWVPRLDWPATLGGFISALRPKREKVSPRYLYHWFSWEQVQSELRGCARQTTNISNLDLNQALDLRIPLPPLEEQRRIAAILDKADALRQKRSRALQKLDSLTHSIFLDMFGDPATNPKRWPIESLGESLNFVTSGGRGWAEFYSDSGSRFLRSLDVRMNHISGSNPAFVNPPDNAEARRTRVEDGDVLLTITGSRIGRVSSVPVDLEGAYISQHVAILRLDQKRMNPRFVSFFLSLETGGQRQIANAQYGQTKPGLNFDQIRRFQIVAPPIKAQEQFVRHIMDFEDLRESVCDSGVKTDALFASLQHRAFRGEL